MDFVVRPGTLPDVPAIIAFVKASWARTYDPVIGEAARREKSGAKHVPALFEGEITKGDGISVAAFDGQGTIIGYAGGFLKNNGFGFIDHIHVDPLFWGQGVAAAMLNEAVNQIRGRAKGLELTVLLGNERALGFYLKYGFEIAETLGPEHGMGGVGVHLMQYRL